MLCLLQRKDQDLKKKFNLDKILFHVKFTKRPKRNFTKVFFSWIPSKKFLIDKEKRIEVTFKKDFFPFDRKGLRNCRLNRLIINYHEPSIHSEIFFSLKKAFNPSTIS